MSVINPEPTVSVSKPSRRHPLTMNAAMGGGILAPVEIGRYRRITSGGGAEALIDCVGSRSLEGGRGRT
jgi:hypothetical protein